MSVSQSPKIASDSALDFLNTEFPVRGVVHDDLATGEGLLDWMIDLGLCDPSAKAQYHAKPVHCESVAAQARILRSWFRRIVERTVTGELATDALPLGPLETILQGEAQAFDGSIVTPDDLLKPIAQDLHRFLQTITPERVRTCRAETCDLWFVDKSRANSRSWCSMRTCGNRHKAAEFRQRKGAA